MYKTHNCLILFIRFSILEHRGKEGWLFRLASLFGTFVFSSNGLKTSRPAFGKSVDRNRRCSRDKINGILRSNGRSNRRRNRGILRYIKVGSRRDISAEQLGTLWNNARNCIDVCPSVDVPRDDHVVTVRRELSDRRLANHYGWDDTRAYGPVADVEYLRGEKRLQFQCMS